MHFGSKPGCQDCCLLQLVKMSLSCCNLETFEWLWWSSAHLAWQPSKYPVIRTNNADISATVTAVTSGFFNYSGEEGQKGEGSLLTKTLWVNCLVQGSSIVNLHFWALSFSHTAFSFFSFSHNPLSNPWPIFLHYGELRLSLGLGKQDLKQSQKTLTQERRCSPRRGKRAW